MSIGLVSVIIPVYNGLPDLDVQLEALDAQNYRGDFEVVISDNGSTDGLREHLDRLETELDIRWVDSSAVKGVSHAKNVGIAAARGVFLAFTDADDAVYSDWLTELTRAAENYDAVGGAIEVDSLNSAEVASWRRIPKPDERFETMYLPYSHGNNFGIWSRAMNELGGFDEELGAGEDMDISWRVQEAGLSLGHVPGAMVAYRLRGSVGAAFRQGVGYGLASCSLIRKHSAYGCPNPPLLRALPVHLWSIAVVATIRNPWLPQSLNPLPRGQWALILGQQWGAFRGRAHLIRKLITRRVRPR